MVSLVTTSLIVRKTLHDNPHDSSIVLSGSPKSEALDSKNKSSFPVISLSSSAFASAVNDPDSFGPDGCVKANSYIKGAE